MARPFYAYILHQDGAADDTAFELITAAGKIDPDASVTALVIGAGAELDAVCNELSSTYEEIWKIDNEAVTYPNADIIRGLLVRILPQDAIVLVPHEHFGMDLSPGLSIKLDAAYIPDAIDLEGIEGETLKAIREEYNGMFSTHMGYDISGGAVINLRPGAFQADESNGANGRVVDKTGEAMAEDLPPSGRRFLEVAEAEVGDVDITKSEVLVSVGRGIEDEDNMEIVFDLAEAMGADVSCSRPIVDSKWLEKPRQVGSSGQTVKPKIYLACGISGSFQHLAGLKGNPSIIAINKYGKAPIFQVAEVGIEADLLDFIPELTEKIKGL